MLELSDT